MADVNIRVPTGVAELDAVLGGGLPENSMTLVKGPPGSFKTILCLQYLYHGAKNLKEPGLYITFNQQVLRILDQAAQFGWNFKNLPVKFVAFDTTKDADIMSKTVEAIRDSKAKRVVMDSLSSYISMPPIIKEDFQADQLYEMLKKMPGFSISEDMLIRALTARMLQKVQNLGSNIIFIFEDPTNDGARMICEYLMDGVIKLNMVEALGKRTIAIEKMRYTKHDFLPRTISLSATGLKIDK